MGCLRQPTLPLSIRIKVRSTKVDAGDFKHELLNRLRSTMAVNVLIKFESSRHIFDKIKISNFTKIRPTEAELYHADGGTGRHDEANSHFSRFCGSV